MNVYIGEKYYYYTEDDDGNDILNIIRILKIFKNQITAILNGTKIQLTTEDLSKYIKLKPAGYINFAVVELGDKNEDVITMLFKNTLDNNTEKTKMTPYAVCRQAVADVFANQILRDDSVFMVGTSVNIDNCPTNTDYNMLLACDKLKYYKIVACYLDDTIDNILQLISTAKFDETLMRLYNKAPTIVNQMKVNMPVHGFCKNLRELLQANDFDYDFNCAFNIHKINVEMKFNSNTLQIDSDLINLIETIVEKRVFNTYVVKYDNTINLNLIKRNYVFISDNNNDLYIVAYDSGETLNLHDKDQYLSMRNTMFNFKKAMPSFSDKF